MNRVIVSPEAANDLRQIHDYIDCELQNPAAAKKTMKALRESIESLQDFPERGTPLDAVLSVHTPYRYLVCGRYYIFYLTDGSAVEVIRILHTLQNYMKALFP